MAKHRRNGVFLVVLFAFSAWSLRVSLANFDTLSNLTLAGVLNEVLRAAIFVGPVFLYARYVEKAPTLAFLEISRPRASFAWVLPLVAAPFVVWHLLLDQIVGDRMLASVAPPIVLFTALSPATLVEEIFFRGFPLNEFWQTTDFWRANLASSSLFALVRLPGWFALGKAMPLFVTDALSLLVLGMVFGRAVKKTGSLWTAHILHTLNNLLFVMILGALHRRIAFHLARAGELAFEDLAGPRLDQDARKKRKRDGSAAHLRRKSWV
jgi:membrane protease YdiL (CAAX protease family)